MPVCSPSVASIWPTGFGGLFGPSTLSEYVEWLLGVLCRSSWMLRVE